MASRGTAARRQGGTSPESGSAQALLTILARALRLSRAALLVEEPDGLTLVRVAVHGRVRLARLRRGEEPPDGPWTLALPLGAGAHSSGLLLLARTEPLQPADHELVERLAFGVTRVIEQARTAADLAHARQLLARADRLAALGTLAAGVAHEIRNPLVSVRTFIQLLPERLSDEEFRTEFRALALNEIERICALINDLLAFSRPAPAQREPTAMNDLVGQIARLLDAEARKHDVSIVVRTDPRLPLAVVDEAQVKQVLMNVILNAIQACESRGSVEIGTVGEERAGAGWCIVSVADSGSGIPPEHRHHIFDPFFTTKNAGSGLGLFIAHQIVSDHGGYIATAPREGGGTVFAIHFPLEAGLDHAGTATG